jgi:hypothetical protein
MKKQTRLLIYSLMILADFFIQPHLFAATTKDVTGTEADQNLNKKLTGSDYVLETDQAMASDSLNRISGNIDMGFSAPENTFKSPDHYGAGPFAKEKAEISKASANSN